MTTRGASGDRPTTLPALGCRQWCDSVRAHWLGRAPAKLADALATAGDDAGIDLDRHDVRDRVLTGTRWQPSTVRRLVRRFTEHGFLAAVRPPRGPDWGAYAFTVPVELPTR